MTGDSITRADGGPAAAAPPRAAPARGWPGTVLRLARKAAELVSVLLFAGLFLNYVAQVFMRYVMNDPLIWTLEAAGILFISVSLWTAVTQMPFREHVGFDLLRDALPPMGRRIVTSISLGIFAVLAFWSLPDTWALLDYMYAERTYALNFNLGHLFLLMMVFVAGYGLRALWTIRQIWARSDAP